MIRKQALEILKEQKFTQSQDSLADQLFELRYFANALGLYDAADFCEKHAFRMMGKPFTMDKK